LFIAFNNTIYSYKGMFTSIATISSAAKRRGHEVELLVIKHQWATQDDVLRKVRAVNPDLVGFSIMSCDYRYACRLATAVKAHTTAKTIFGGIHVTLHPEEVLAQGCVDFACVGEGEYPTVELLDRIEAGEEGDGIDNIWRMHQGRVVKTPLRALNDLDELPAPDVELFYKKGTAINYVTLMSVGCPYNCSHCYNHVLKQKYKGLGRYVRIKSVPRVIEEMARAKSDYRVKAVIFLDDLPTHNRSWVRGFCREYGERIGVPFWTFARVEHVDDELLGLLRDAGCSRVRLGIETVDEEVREGVLQKHAEDEEIAKKARMIKDYGLDLEVLVMIGMPGEDERSLRATYEFIRQIGPDYVRVSTATPYEGTRLWKICEERNLQPSGDVPMTFNSPDTCIGYPAAHRRLIRKYFKKIYNLNTPKKYKVLGRARILQWIYRWSKLVISDYDLERLYFKAQDIPKHIVQWKLKTG
jgi:radical SAM superfamily enzyme YgiQ (UPF0313 family)